ncbi:MAG: ExbD/TolR family protein [Panacagrimonas sp.]
MDVVFILLFFFMLASHHLEWRALPVELSAVSATPAPTSARPLVVVMLADGALRVAGAAVSREALIERIVGSGQGAPVVVVPGRSVTMQELIDLVDALRITGAHISLGNPERTS